MSGAMDGQQVVITGATSGIGLATACALAREGAQLSLLGRSEARAAASRATILEAAPAARLRFFLADLSSQQEIRRVAQELREALPALHVLINNAGVVLTKRSVTEDGIERTFAVNHLAYFLLTHELMALLRATPQARIVSVASDAHRFVRDIYWDDVQLAQGYGVRKAYGQSKLANILFNRELARRLEGSGLTANCLHPGGVATGLGAQNGLFGKYVTRLLRPLMKSPDDGADTSVFLAADSAVADSSGGYYAKRKLVEASTGARSDVSAGRLWALSEQMTGIA